MNLFINDRREFDYVCEWSQEAPIFFPVCLCVQSPAAVYLHRKTFPTCLFWKQHPRREKFLCSAKYQLERSISWSALLGGFFRELFAFEIMLSIRLISSFPTSVWSSMLSPFLALSHLLINSFYFRRPPNVSYFSPCGLSHTFDTILTNSLLMEYLHGTLISPHLWTPIYETTA